MAAIVLIALVLLRVTLDYVLINLHLGITHFYNLSVSHFAFAFLAIFLCFIIGFLIRVSLDHVHLLKHHEALQHQQVVSELNLLKVQVQPHFMFNTLNNIYSLAHKKSDKTAEVVAKLSDIMRYFVHDAVKETVLLSTEISFVKSYIELERIRMLHPLCVEFEINTTGHEVLIPPMLFIPFVENFFKHGLDKTKTDNSLWIELLQNDHEISFIIKNRILKNHPVSTAGVGIENVKKRLLILYQNNFDLRIKEENNLFSVSLKIPSHYELSLPNRR